MFSHLHVHTAYSLLDGQGTIKKLLDRAKELGQRAMAITDHGVMYGVVDFYQYAKEIGIKPILGCEVYTSARTRFDKVHQLDSKSGHLILLVKNSQGWKNLIKIVSNAFLEGFYYKPRIDIDILRQHSDGLVALSACMFGDIPRAILRGDFDTAKNKAAELKDIFGKENFFIELQNHGMQEQIELNSHLIKLASQMDLSLVATNDVHYVRREDAKFQDILMCIQTGKTLDDTERMKFDGDELYLKSESEMAELFKDAPDAIENTNKVADICNLELDLNSVHLPEYDLAGEIDPFGYLKNLCNEGFAVRYGDNKVARERLNYELNVIKEMGYVGYFLIVWDFIKYAKDNNIMVGPGRGSAAGSIVSFCLEITNINPIKYSLLFERFLNPERISMPDIDVDFCYERRQEIIDYVTNKYGKEHVCQIITFGTMAARASIRDVGRTLGVPLANVDRIAKMIPFELEVTIQKALKENADLRRQYQRDVQTRKIIDAAKELEGLPRHASKHAAGVVITKEPLTDYLPLQKTGDFVVSQFNMGDIEKLGILKVDFLGLKNLTMIKYALANIKEISGIEIDINTISLDDPKVYKMLRLSDTEGVFQLESAGMKQFLKSLKPRCFEDIIIAVSTYRPGPMDQIPVYLENRNDPSKIRYKHPLLENILSVTHGCVIYQEQVMQIVRELAGYSMGRADIVRRAMAKKKADTMEKEKKNFIYGVENSKGEIEVEGCIRHGIDEKVASDIFEELMSFASYAFNKSHAAAYALIAYQTAWLKCNYTSEFMAALLSVVMDNEARLSKYLSEMRRMGLRLLLPNINKSDSYFKVEKGHIRYGLSALKGIGMQLVSKIIVERERSGEFVSFENFCRRMHGRDLNKRSLEVLISCGVFNVFGVSKEVLLVEKEKILASANYEKKHVLKGQIGLFDQA